MSSAIAVNLEEPLSPDEHQHYSHREFGFCVAHRACMQAGITRAGCCCCLGKCFLLP
jgi:hypothetical protein